MRICWCTRRLECVSHSAMKNVILQYLIKWLTQLGWSCLIELVHCIGSWSIYAADLFCRWCCFVTHIFVCRAAAVVATTISKRTFRCVLYAFLLAVLFDIWQCFLRSEYDGATATATTFQGRIADLDPLYQVLQCHMSTKYFPKLSWQFGFIPSSKTQLHINVINCLLQLSATHTSCINIVAVHST